jgi:hypothetical protein
MARPPPPGKYPDDPELMAAAKELERLNRTVRAVPIRETETAGVSVAISWLLTEATKPRLPGLPEEPAA